MPATSKDERIPRTAGSSRAPRRRRSPRNATLTARPKPGDGRSAHTAAEAPAVNADAGVGDWTQPSPADELASALIALPQASTRMQAVADSVRNASERAPASQKSATSAGKTGGKRRQACLILHGSAILCRCLQVALDGGAGGPAPLSRWESRRAPLADALEPIEAVVNLGLRFG